MSGTDISVLRKRNGLNLWPFFLEITREITHDSKRIYDLISGFVFVMICVLSISRALFQVSTIEIQQMILSETSGIFLLIPPFTLAIIAMFPAFPKATKDALSQALPNKFPLGTVFLNQFVFITFWSLVMLAHNVSSSCFLKSISKDPNIWFGFACDINFGLWTIFIFALFYEVIHSLKLLYMMVLKDYFGPEGFRERK